MTNPILKKSLAYYNFLHSKKLEDLKAQRECQLWSDKGLKNHLEFTEMPEIPRVEVKKEKWSVGLFNMCRQMLP